MGAPRMLGMLGIPPAARGWFNGKEGADWTRSGSDWIWIGSRLYLDWIWIGSGSNLDWIGSRLYWISIELDLDCIGSGLYWIWIGSELDWFLIVSELDWIWIVSELDWIWIVYELDWIWTGLDWIWTGLDLDWIGFWSDWIDPLHQLGSINWRNWASPIGLPSNCRRSGRGRWETPADPRWRPHRTTPPRRNTNRASWIRSRRSESCTLDLQPNSKINHQQPIQQ